MILQEFIDNNYNIDDFKQYSDFLIECSNKDYSNYPTHKHHILPKLMNGSNISHNLIVLNYEDHFIAHLILANCFEVGTPEYKSNLYACKLITSYIKKYMNIKNYEVPEKYSEFWSLSDTLFKDFGKGINNHFYGKTHTEETREIIKEKRAKQVFSDELKETFRNHLLSLPNTQKGELNPMYGKTFEEFYGEEKAAIIKQKLKDARPNYVRTIPDGIFECDVVIDNIRKLYYRLCPDCNCEIYYNGKSQQDWYTLRKSHTSNVLCNDCRVKKRYPILKIPQRTQTTCIASRVIIQDSRTGIIYDSKVELQRQLNMSRYVCNNLIRSGTLIIVEDLRTGKLKNEDRIKLKP